MRLVVISAIVVFSAKDAPLGLVGPSFETPAIFIGGIAFAAIGFLLSGLNLFAMTAGGLIAGFAVAILAGVVARTSEPRSARRWVCPPSGRKGRAWPNGRTAPWCC